MIFGCELSQTRIEDDKTPQQAMTSVMKEDTELFRQFADNQDFMRRSVCGLVSDRIVEPGL